MVVETWPANRQPIPVVSGRECVSRHGTPQLQFAIRAHQVQAVLSCTACQQIDQVAAKQGVIAAVVHAGSLSLLPPGASPHAIAGLLKRFLLGLPEPLLTYR